MFSGLFGYRDSADTAYTWALVLTVVVVGFVIYIRHTRTMRRIRDDLHAQDLQQARDAGRRHGNNQT